ncbi:hypothetical protein M3Y99_01158500 [Aphelenchoides fujianensis]|nr:hypothetical protein M3Y99_01158500 [Aphelenchoides fujianensis]
MAANTLKKAAIADINRGLLDKAVEKLQKSVRISASKGAAADSSSTVPLWALLAEAYKQKGNLPSAARVNQTILEIVPDFPHARLQLIEIYRSMGQYEKSVEQARLLTEGNNCPDHLRPFLALHYAHSLVLYVQTIQLFEKRLELLAECIPLIQSLVQSDKTVLFQKILAIFLGVVQKMSVSMFPLIKQKLRLEELGIADRPSLLEKRMAALSRVLRSNSEHADSWNDLSLALAELCLKRAISLPASAQRRSVFWANLGLLQVKKLEIKRAAHCFIRALQLNQRNDRAWCSLAIVSMRAGQVQEAISFLQTAQQIDSDLMETWCGLAVHAELTGHFDAMDLYRHSMVLRPNRFAAIKYSFFVTQSLMNKMPVTEATMVDLERVLDLQYANGHDEKLLLSLAVLAERFWELEAAIRFASQLNLSDGQNRGHYARMLLKARQGDASCDNAVDTNDAFVQRLLTLYRSTNEDLLQMLLNIPLFNRLFSAIAADDPGTFRFMYSPSLFPMVALYSILFQKTQQVEQVVVRDHRLTHELSSLLTKLNESRPTAPPTVEEPELSQMKAKEPAAVADEELEDE